jgi:hypothetical protein
MVRGRPQASNFENTGGEYQRQIEDQIPRFFYLMVFINNGKNKI